MPDINYIHLIDRYGPRRLRLFQSLIFILAATAVDIISTILIAWILSKSLFASSHLNTETLSYLPDMAYFILDWITNNAIFSVTMLLITKAVTGTISTYVVYKTSLSCSIQNRKLVINAVINNIIDRGREKNLGDLYFLVNEIPIRFSLNFILPFLSMIHNLVVVFLYFIALTFIFPTAALAFSAILLVSGFIFLSITRRYSIKFLAAVNLALSQLSIQISDLGKSIISYILFKNAEYIVKKMDVQASSHIKNASFFETINVSFKYFFEIAIILSIFIVFHVVGSGREGFIMEALMLFGLSALRVVPSVTQLTGNLNSVKGSSDTIKRFLSVLSMGTPGKWNIGWNSIGDRFGLGEIRFQFGSSRLISINGRAVRISESSNEIFRFGELNVISGRSGVGKSTILNWIGGVGTESIEGLSAEYTDAQGQISGPDGKVIGYCPQEPEFSSGSLIEAITFGNKVQFNDLSSSQVSALNQLFPNSFVSSAFNDNLRNFDSFSGGEKKRLGMFGAFLCGDQLILADEPTAGLDAVAQKAMIEWLVNIARDHFLIIVTHDLELIKRSHNVITMEDSVES